MAIYRCKICNYVYDEQEKGINFKELGKDYRCPKCRAGKFRFEKKALPK